MWHSGSKCQRIGASIKTRRKWLKVVLALGVRNFGPSFVVSKLVEFPLFDDFFLDLANFPDLDNFQDLDVFPDFLAYSTPFLLIPNLSTLPFPSFFPKAILLLLFLLKANLLLLFLLGTSLLGDLVIFSIEISRAAILLKP